jgi:hypothetical protein
MARQRIIFAFVSPTSATWPFQVRGKWGESGRLKATDNAVSPHESDWHQPGTLVHRGPPIGEPVTVAFDVQIKLYPISLCRQAELIAG